MRKITQFSTNNKYTQPAPRLVGALGLVNCSVGCLEQLGWEQGSLGKLTPRIQKIICHYLTEPQKVDFVQVTTFLNGLIYGIDIESKKDCFEKLFSIKRTEKGPKRLPFSNGEIKVYNANCLSDLTQEYLERFPIEEGEGPFFEANSEVFSGDEGIKDIKEGRIYAGLAIGKPVNDEQCYLLMEDSGYITDGMDEAIIESLAFSIYACEIRENLKNNSTKYEEIYVVSVFDDFKIGMPKHAQVQMIYAAPPKKILG